MSFTSPEASFCSSKCSWLIPSNCKTSSPTSRISVSVSTTYTETFLSVTQPALVSGATSNSALSRMTSATSLLTRLNSKSSIGMELLHRDDFLDSTQNASWHHRKVGSRVQQVMHINGIIQTTLRHFCSSSKVSAESLAMRALIWCFLFEPLDLSPFAALGQLVTR